MGYSSPNCRCEIAYSEEMKDRYLISVFNLPVSDLSYIKLKVNPVTMQPIKPCILTEFENWWGYTLFLKGFGEGYLADMHKLHNAFTFDGPKPFATLDLNDDDRPLAPRKFSMSRKKEN